MFRIAARVLRRGSCLARSPRRDRRRGRGTTWSRPSESSREVRAACTGLGVGERSVIYLAWALGADLILIDEGRARRAAKSLELNVAGSLAILERGARLGRVDDLRSVYLSLLEQGIRYDRGLLDQSLGRLGFPKLKVV